MSLTKQETKLAIWSFDEVEGKWIAYADYLTLEKRALDAEARVKQIKEIIYSDADHPRHCSAICGPGDETWCEPEKCNCFLKELKELLETPL